MRTNPLAPDSLASEQFASVFQSGCELPEKRLCIAVLLAAFAEFQDALVAPRRRGEWTRDELVAWFFSRDRSWLYSFENLCEYLDLSADCIRGRLASLLAKQRLPVPAAQGNC